MALRIGLSSGALYPDYPTEEILPVAANLGINDVELMLQSPSELDESYFRKVKKVSIETGVHVRSFHAFQRFHPLFDRYERRRVDGWSMFDRLLEGATEVGAKIIVWHGSCPNYDGDVSPQAFEDTVFALGNRCRKYDLKLAIENVSWCKLRSVREVLALAAALPSAGNIGFTFDPFQATASGANLFMVLAAMEGHLFHVHLRDAFTDRPEQRALLPGEGDLPWSALVRAIANAGYNGPMMLEGSLVENRETRMAAVANLLDPLLRNSEANSDFCAGPLPPGVLEGIRLFNQGEYYECHEVIEHEWHAERGQVRRLYQGILQIGVGLHHTRNGNYRGAVALLTDGIDKVSAFVPECRGVDTAVLVEQSQECLKQVQSRGPGKLQEFDWTLAPIIQESAGPGTSSTIQNPAMGMQRRSEAP